MKIGVKITLLVAIAAAGIAVLSILSLSSINTLDQMFDTLSHRFMLNQHYATAIRADINNMRNESAMIFLNHDQAEERLERNTESIEHALLTLDSLKENAVAPEMVERVDKFEKAFHKQLELRAKFKELVSAGKFDEGQDLRTHQFEDAMTTSVLAVKDIVDYATQQSEDYASIVSTAEAAHARVIMTITIVIVAIVLVIFSIIIIMGITKPLKKAVEAADNVAQGNLDVDLATNSKDETGILMHSLDTMVKSINRLITDTSSLSATAIEGQLEVRADANKHKGAFKDLIIGINKTLDAVIGPLNMTAEYVDRISKGDIPPRITEVYRGDFNEIKNNLNSCMDSIELLMNEINVSIKEATNGKLKYRADVTMFKGDYSKIMEGVNSLVDTFVEPLEVVSQFLSDIAKGDDKVQKMTKEYKGDFNIMKNAVNTTHDVLFTVLGEMIKASEHAERGELDNIKIDITKVEGAWTIIMDALNKIGVAAGSIINEAGEVLSTMATGDLTVRITKEYPGKFGEMRNNINNLGNSLTDLISQLADSIHTTAAASAQISATAETIATATQEQSSQTDEVAGAVEEMSRTVTENAHSAGKTADVAKQSGEVANSGGKVVEQTVAKMREISEVVRSSAENIAKLGESSKKIGEIISVIDDIADQTNLLSLNAAIEAARAGEQGRGFAVVADSVGKLAISTAAATKEIADMIKGIQMDTEAAVRAMEKGTSEVQSGIELADSAGNSIQNILRGINDLLAMVNQIAAASDEQSATSEQIAKNVSSMSKVTAESAKNIEDVASTANELAKMTDTLTSLVSQFKISGGQHQSSYSNSLSNKKNDRYLEE